jgi:hypothetical protein
MSLDRVATALWTVTSELIVALDEHFGEPIDAYVNGSQVWLRPDGPNGITIEYRLHPVGGYIRPNGMRTDEVFGNIALALATGTEPSVPYTELWEGLEAFVAFEDEGPLSPAELASIGRAEIGIEPEAAGMVDHEAIAVAWQQSNRATSIVAGLRSQLSG